MLDITYAYSCKDNGFPERETKYGTDHALIILTSLQLGISVARSASFIAPASSKAVANVTNRALARLDVVKRFVRSC